MLDPAVLPGFLAAVVLVAAAPGPDNAYIAAVAVAHGARAGVLSAIGMALGMVVHVSAAAVGLALLLRSSPAAIDAVRLAGAAYLGWLALSTLAAARRGGPHDGPAHRRMVLRATLTNLTNPKVILFFAAFLPQFVRAGHGPAAVQLLTLGAIFLLVGLVLDSAVGLAAGRLGGALGHGGRAAVALRSASALTFAALAVLLAAEALRGA